MVERGGGGGGGVVLITSEDDITVIAFKAGVKIHFQIGFGTSTLEVVVRFQIVRF